MRLEREYSIATASRSPAHVFTNVDGPDLLEVREDGSVLVGPATSYWIQVGRGRGAEAGCSSTRSGPPARLQPRHAIHVAGGAVAGGASVTDGGRCQPQKCGPELRGSTHAGA